MTKSRKKASSSTNMHAIPTNEAIMNMAAVTGLRLVTMRNAGTTVSAAKT